MSAAEVNLFSCAAASAGAPWKAAFYAEATPAIASINIVSLDTVSREFKLASFRWKTLSWLKGMPL